MNCDRLSLTCENGNAECVENPGFIYCERDHCAIGDPPLCTANGEFNLILACAPRVFADCEGRVLNDLASQYRCAAGEMCQFGACVPTCNTERCDCPVTYEPACAEDGRTYWNDCWMACAGERAGTGCLQDEVVLVGDLGRTATAFVPLGPRRALVAERNDRYMQDPRLICVVEFEPDGAGFSIRNQLCRRDLLGIDLQAVAFGEEWLVLSEAGFEAFFTRVNDSLIETDRRGLDASLSYGGVSLERIGDQVLLANGQRLSVVDMDEAGEVQVHVAQTYGYLLPREDFDPSTSDFVRLSDGRMLYAGSWGSESQIYELEADPLRREFVTKLGTVHYGINTTRFWGAPGTEALVLGARRTDFVSKWTRIADEVWMDGCFERRLYGELTASEQASDRGFRAADFDGDGGEELVVSTGERMLLLGRAPNGFLHIRADIPLRADFPWTDIVPADLDADGRAEIVVMHELGLDPEAPFPSSPIFRVTPHAPSLSDP